MFSFATRDFNWLTTHLPTDNSVSLRDITTSYGVLNVAGPYARKLLLAAAEGGLEGEIENGVFPFMSCRRISIGVHTLLAMRVTYVGELGYELHIPSEQMEGVYKLLWTAKERNPGWNVRNAGYRVLDSLRLEKGYRVWSSDISPLTNPYEAGLGFCIKYKKTGMDGKYGGKFIGEDACARIQAAGVQRKLVCFTILSSSLLPACIGFPNKVGEGEDEHMDVSGPMVLYGNEAISKNGTVIGFSTSAGFGYTIDKYIVYGYIPIEYIGNEKEIDEKNECFELNVYGTLVRMQRHVPLNRSLYDWKREKILA